MGSETNIIQGRSNANYRSDTSVLTSCNARAGILKHNAFFCLLAQSLHALKVGIAKGLGAGAFCTNHEVFDNIARIKLPLDLLDAKLACWPWRIRHCDSPHTMLLRHRECFTQTRNDWYTQLLCLRTEQCILLLRNCFELLWPIVCWHQSFEHILINFAMHVLEIEFLVNFVSIWGQQVSEHCKVDVISKNQRAINVEQKSGVFEPSSSPRCLRVIRITC